MKHLKRDVFRLAGTYLSIIMVMSIGFSAIFYNASVRELGRRSRDIDGGQMMTPRWARDAEFHDYMERHAMESRQALLVDLILVNTLALIVGSILGYLLAVRTLRPIEQNMEAQSQFVSDASHELRTPLTALRTANEVALRNKHLKLADAKQVIADNITDIARLQDLTNSMLGLLRDDEGAMNHTVALRDVMSDAMNLVVSQALAKDIAIEDTIAPVSVQGNHQQLVQLMTILLDNAIKYSYDHTTVRVDVKRQGKQAVVTVRDEGIGMDAVTASKIFTRFYRAEQSRTTTGYGLGLAIAEKIVKAYRGSIKVESEVGKGASSIVILPVTTSIKNANESL